LYVQQLYIRKHEEISEILVIIGFRYSISDCEQIMPGDFNISFTNNTSPVSLIIYSRYGQYKAND